MKSCKKGFYIKDICTWIINWKFSKRPVNKQIMFCDHPAEKLGHKIPTLSLRFAKTRKEWFASRQQGFKQIVFDHMKFVYLWWQFSTLIGLSQAGENGPHEVTKTRCFFLGFCGNFLHLGGSVSWAGRSGNLTTYGICFPFQVCINFTVQVLCNGLAPMNDRVRH